MNAKSRDPCLIDQKRRRALRVALAGTALYATGTRAFPGLSMGENTTAQPQGTDPIFRDGFETTLAYSTSFDSNETPMVEDGGWIQAGTVAGSNWQNVNTNGGLGFGVGPSAIYDDCTACRAGFNNARHRARAVIHRAAGYSAPSTHEVELVVAVNIGPNSVRLYEWLWSIAGGLQVVRWNGPPSDFKVDLPLTGPGVGTPHHGDVMEFRYDATNPSQVVLTCYANNVLVATVTDNTPGRILTGNPGLSFFARAGAGLNMSSYCFSEWSCSSP